MNPETPDLLSAVPQAFSPWEMFLNAHPVVQAVMVGLAVASVITWTVWLAKTIEIRRARARVLRLCAALAEARSLDEARGADDGSVEAALVAAAATEARLSAGARDGLKDRVASRLERIEAGAGRRLGRGTGILASIGSTAPFVGLFGTVWGIMNSFIGIAQSHTTNLAVVAPGIAEALLATAMGLIAAIPAVVIYNLFVRAIAAYRAQLADASAEVLRIVSRDLDRRVLPHREAAE